MNQGDDGQVPNDRGHQPEAAGHPNVESDGEEGEDALLNDLIDRINNSGNGQRGGELIDRERARHLLEASNYDVDLAADFYWEDYYASNAARLAANDRPPRRANREQGAGRRVRRRTDNSSSNEDNDDDDDDDEEQARNNSNSSEDEEDDSEEMEEAEQPEAVAQGDGAQQDQPRGEETVSVSDDELDRKARRRANRRRQVMAAAAEGRVARNVSGEGESAPNETNNEEDTNAAIDEDTNADLEYLSDSDYIFQEDGPPDESTKTPLAILWGRPHLPKKDKAAARSDEAENPDEGADNNVVAADVGEEGKEDGPANEDISEEEGVVPPPFAKIPRTWLNAGFNESTCATGLVVKPPSDEQITLFRWKQAQSDNRSLELPPPHHCRAITALLSVVTALIYSGAVVQGGEITDRSTETPFAELTEEQRKDQFEQRLGDALTVLVHLAANVSLTRKKRGLARRKEMAENTEADAGLPPAELVLKKRRQQIIRRRLPLVPTCRWEEEVSGDDETDKDIRINTSYTSIEDLHCYIRSNMSAWTSRGGCALFLETIVRIHGKSCVERMLHLARQEDATTSLIRCTCKERQKDMPKSKKKLKNMTMLELSDTTPPGHSCVSTELISLLLTGKVHSLFKGWSTNRLGFGFLSNQRDVVCRPLMLPNKPVWVLRGNTCYSVLWHDGSKEKIEASDVNMENKVLQLVHWNCWYNQRNKSDVRIITARKDWKRSSFDINDSPDPTMKTTVTEAILQRRRHNEELARVVSSDENGDDSDSITDAEINRVEVNPEDMKLFPNKYRQWRFDMGKAPPTDADGDKKMPAMMDNKPHWVPYFRLDDRQRMVVEMKLAPKINRILWTRWPRATVTKIEPNSPEPIV